MSTPSTPTHHETAQDARLRERMAAVFDAWRYMDAHLDDMLDRGDLVAADSRELARHQQRMADAIDRLQRQWVLHRTAGGT